MTFKACVVMASVVLYLTAGASRQALGEEGIWFYRGKDYIATADEKVLEIYPEFSWVPNIKGGGGVRNLHEVLGEPEGERLRDALSAFIDNRHHDDKTEEIKIIIKEWFGLDESVSTSAFQEVVIQKLDGLIVTIAHGELAPCSIEYLLRNPTKSFSRFCDVLDAMITVHYPTGIPVSAVIACIGEADDPLPCFARSTHGLPLSGGHGAYRIVQMLHSMQYLYEGYLAREKLTRVLSQIGNNNEDFNSFLATSIDSTLIVEGGRDILSPAENAPPPKASVIIGRKGTLKLNGSDEDDFIFGGLGDSRIRGGKGNDVLVSGNGKTEYVFCTGDGKDTIFCHPLLSKGVDTVYFPDRKMRDAHMVTIPNAIGAGQYTLRITFENSNDEITIISACNTWDEPNHPARKIGAIVFSDGIVQPGAICENK
ncbi:MAG: hypothetical protein LIP23_04060 [Planctomycetes bacterium]|nr:hypothetical protein [Planctomycetota bacterium]